MNQSNTGSWHRRGNTIILDDPFAVDPGQAEMSGEGAKRPPGGPEQTKLLKIFFGTSVAGARKRMADFWVPKGLTRTTLEWYRDNVAARALANPLTDPTPRLGQSLRLQLIDRALQGGGLDPELQVDGFPGAQRMR